MEFENWIHTRLGAVALFINGRAYKQTEFKDDGTPIVRIQNLTGKGNTVFSDLDLPDDKYIDKGDLIYAWSATFGPYIWTGPKSIYHYHIWKIIPNEEIVNRRYLYYKLLHISDFIKNQGTGSIFTHITKSLMESYQIDIHPLPQQHKIASTLGALDDKIELNNQMNQTLETMAKALFKSWFVDFDPFANGEFEESELGMIPKGWRVGKFNDLCKILNGYAFKSQWWQDEGVKVVKIKNIDGTKVNIDDCQCVSEELSKQYSKFLLQDGDMLIAMTGATVGKVGVVNTEGQKLLLNQRVGKFIPIEIADAYIKTFIREDKFFDAIQNTAYGSAQPNISAGDIENMSIIIPNEQVLKEFERSVSPMFQQILENNKQTSILKRTRDSLLPKLMSGEIELAEV